MRSQPQHFIVFFVTALLLALTSQSLFAFSITPAQPGADTYDASEDYFPPGLMGTTTLNPLSVTSIARGGTAGFLAELKDTRTIIQY